MQTPTFAIVLLHNAYLDQAPRFLRRICTIAPVSPEDSGLGPNEMTSSKGYHKKDIVLKEEFKFLL